MPIVNATTDFVAQLDSTELNNNLADNEIFVSLVASNILLSAPENPLLKKLREKLGWLDDPQQPMEDLASYMARQIILKHLESDMESAKKSGTLEKVLLKYIDNANTIILNCLLLLNSVPSVFDMDTDEEQLREVLAHSRQTALVEAAAREEGGFILEATNTQGIGPSTWVGQTASEVEHQRVPPNEPQHVDTRNMEKTSKRRSFETKVILQKWRRAAENDNENPSVSDQLIGFDELDRPYRRPGYVSERSHSGSTTRVGTPFHSKDKPKEGKSNPPSPVESLQSSVSDTQHHKPEILIDGTIGVTPRDGMVEHLLQRLEVVIGEVHLVMNLPLMVEIGGLLVDIPIHILQLA
ncbi:hypothetical protein DL96DRAFT_1719468 [Flagelloscypha sp. PMI_526]|nr:hypothetical protein DL96DRAFT_1719468 [Flagelloscypha sp. PMI_526]